MTGRCSTRTFLAKNAEVGAMLGSTAGCWKPERVGGCGRPLLDRAVVDGALDLHAQHASRQHDVIGCSKREGLAGDVLELTGVCWSRTGWVETDSGRPRPR